MKTLSPIGAVLALSASATIPSAGASAATIYITGDAYTVTNSNTIGTNNVVNGPGSGLIDLTGGTTWRSGGSVFADVANYSVQWYFNGAESGDKIKFKAPGVFPFTENNQNNNYNGGNDPGWSPLLGLTIGSGKDSPIPFMVTDTNYGTGIANGSNNKPDKATSLIFSYVTPDFKHGHITGWELTTTATDWFVFGYDDPGGTDKDFDDYMGVAHVKERKGPPVKPTPLPGALPLMGTVLGAGYILRRWRGYRSSTAA